MLEMDSELGGKVWSLEQGFVEAHLDFVTQPITVTEASADSERKKAREAVESFSSFL